MDDLDDRFHGDKTFWLVRLVATRGIEKVENCKIYRAREDGPAYASRGQCGSADYVFEAIGTSAFETEEAAKVKAKKLLSSRLVGLDKQKAKLKKMLESL